MSLEPDDPDEEEGRVEAQLAREQEDRQRPAPAGRERAGKDPGPGGEREGAQHVAQRQAAREGGGGSQRQRRPCRKRQQRRRGQEQPLEVDAFDHFRFLATVRNSPTNPAAVPRSTPATVSQ